MKRKYKIKIGLLGLLVSLGFVVTAQDSVKHDLVLNVSYFMDNNKIIYLKANTKTKIDTKFQPVKNIQLRLYLDTESDSSFIGKVTTDEMGTAKAVLPPSLKTLWEASSNHTILGFTDPTKEFDATTSETAVLKTKMTIDTSSDGETRNITVTVMALKDGAWVPAKDVEMRVGIKRMGGILSAGDEETYTTDSSGTVLVEVKKDSLPGDEKGNIILAAKVEDNDPYGNLLIEESVPWGVATKTDNSFFQQRTLWSTRFRTPVWLLFMAYSIVLGVWGTLIYLVFQIVKINKLRLQEDT
jgi:hypothetical protein